MYLKRKTEREIIDVDRAEGAADAFASRLWLAHRTGRFTEGRNNLEGGPLHARDNKISRIKRTSSTLAVRIGA